MGERASHEWREKPFHFRIAENGDLWFRDENQDDEWWIADTSGACDAELLAEILRLRRLLEQTLEDLEYMREEGDTDLRTPIHRIRQALNRQEEES